MIEPFNYLKISLRPPSQLENSSPEIVYKIKRIIGDLEALGSDFSRMEISKSCGKHVVFKLPPSTRVRFAIDCLYNNFIKQQVDELSLSHLHLKGTFFDSANFYNLLRSLPQIKSLTLDNLALSSVIDVEKKHPVYHTSFLDELHFDYKSLGELEVSYAITQARDLASGIAKALAEHEVQLEELIIKNCSWMNWLTIRELVSQIPSLRQLSCLNCSLLYLNPINSKQDEGQLTARSVGYTLPWEAPKFNVSFDPSNNHQAPKFNVSLNPPNNYQEDLFYAELPVKFKSLMTEFPKSRLRSFTYSRGNSKPEVLTWL